MPPSTAGREARRHIFRNALRSWSGKKCRCHARQSASRAPRSIPHNDSTWTTGANSARQPDVSPYAMPAPAAFTVTWQEYAATNWNRASERIRAARMLDFFVTQPNKKQAAINGGLLTRKPEFGEHFRPRVRLDAPRAQHLAHGTVENIRNFSVRSRFSARARKTSCEAHALPIPLRFPEFGLTNDDFIGLISPGWGSTRSRDSKVSASLPIGSGRVGDSYWNHSECPLIKKRLPPLEHLHFVCSAARPGCGLKHRPGAFGDLAARRRRYSQAWTPAPHYF